MRKESPELAGEGGARRRTTSGGRARAKGQRRPRGAKARALETDARLARLYPGSATELCALDFENPFQLLVATILSAQTTDQVVNQVTPALFERYPTPEDLGAADAEVLEKFIYSTGFYHSKAMSLIEASADLASSFGGQVPISMEDLTSLRGVGRKTANVVRSVGFGLPGFPVDTHVGRVSRRLGLTRQTDPVKAEEDLDALVAPERRGALSLRMILHGRETCLARAPRCAGCVLNDFCPSAGTTQAGAHV